ncbi:MAG: family 1 glycosylhydrolase [Candidatus Poribacteria bacterium]|nr:family 1 glycosylhydrolase [Candidatus Poribacteria bacterium]
MSTETFISPIQLPDDLLLGCGTSATQIEGGDVEHSWSRWCDLGKVKNGSHTRDSAGHWTRIDEDVALLVEMKQQTYRLGVEWARLEPTKGARNDAAMERYRYEIELLLANGIVPLVTLHHFTNPLWVEDQGGWAHPQTIQDYLAFVRYVMDGLGDLVSDWVTINEPNVFAYYGYRLAIWPPGKRRLWNMRNAVRNMMRAHIHAYRIIHERRRDANVGMAIHYGDFRAINPDKTSDRLYRRVAEHCFQNALLLAHTSGYCVFPYGFNDYPAGSGKFADFIGVNYYQPIRVRCTAKRKQAMIVPPDAPMNDLRWLIDAEGLYNVVKDIHSYVGTPIYITENGTADAKDAFRRKFIFDHLTQLMRARNDGVKIERYYHWSFMDNFEWAEGLSAKFGLVEVEPTTKERRVRPSGKYYADLCESRLLTP